MIEKPQGYFEIGIYFPRTAENIGTLWRSAYQLGASGIFVIGPKPRRQPSDVVQAEKRIPMRHFADFDAFLAARPVGAELVGVEMGGEALSGFTHPARALYLLGSESNGLPCPVMQKCDKLVEIESVNYPSYNVAVSGSLVMYHRCLTRGFAGR